MSGKEEKLVRVELTEEQKKKERFGLTTAEVEELYKEHGFNELPHVEISLLWIFFIQFTGLMPYTLEICCILSLGVQDWEDFCIIAAILICNGLLGFTEELKAKASLDELTSKMEQKIAVLRDGAAEHMLTRLLVPGDVVLMVGGCATPADVEWIEGDVLSIDTASITGEPLPRDYPSDQYGTLILSGTTVKAGEAYCVVRKTGINTEVGGSLAEIMIDKTVAKVSVFEQRVLFIVKIIIVATLFDVLIIFLALGTSEAYDKQFSTTVPTGVYGIPGPKTNENGKIENKIEGLILTCLAIIVASIPVALPLVLQVTMALGAGKMAREFCAVVTSLPALQDISSMNVLCSDKTGTLTTARITIHAESVWYNGKFSKEDVALYAALASNRDKKEDPIDRSVINHFDKTFGPAGIAETDKFVKVRGVGFNPIYKRVVFEFTHPTLGRVTIAKGLSAKVMDTADGGEDDALDQWKVENYKEMSPEVSRADLDFSKAGYKTLGVAVKFNDEPWRFVGILPMLDPPRHDTAQTIKNIQAAGIKVKMITGDHLNIAKETARLIGLGQDIHAGAETREAGDRKNQLIWEADGFAQVLPKDKREVVIVLREHFKIVVGMTGDGVNDAPALSAAQCGIAVDDATDAAKNAAAIILTSPGLSAIYSAVVESRRIFRKLKSYVTYRIAASVQIVVVLTLLIYISNCPITSLYIVILALFNDLTMLPIAYDAQNASAAPENPDVKKILIMSMIFGTMEAGFTLLFAYVATETRFFAADMDIRGCSIPSQAATWLQMSIASEFLIFSARAPSFIVTSIAPSITLFSSVMAGCLFLSLLTGVIPYFGYLNINDIVLIWAYNIITLFFIDCVKVAYLQFIGDSLDVLPEQVPVEDLEEVDDIPIGSPMSDAESGPARIVYEEEDDDKATSVTRRLSNWSDSKGGVDTSMTKKVSDAKIVVRTKVSSSGNIIVARGNSTYGGTGLRGSSTNLRPNTPAQVAIARGPPKK